MAQLGHRVLVELPTLDDTKGLSDYVHAVLDAVGVTGENVIVAASLGAFIAPLVAVVSSSLTLLAGREQPEE